MKIVILIVLLHALVQNLWAIKIGGEDSDFEINCLSYIHYYMQYDTERFDNNRFQVSRAYFTVKKGVFDFMDFRMTIDVYDDDDGVENRLKYLYTKFKLGSHFGLTDISVRLGMIPTPLIDFEQKINNYRMQGTMFLERQKIINSADLGASIEAKFGGEIDEKYKDEVNPANSGKYGSFCIGIYNGPGYNVIEFNRNKVIQWILSLRPFPALIPGLQLSYSGIFGKGNDYDEDNISPDWQTNLFLLSYECPYFTATAQTFFGKGDRLGKLVDENQRSLDYFGYSFFAEGKIFKKVKLFCRYDIFNPNTSVAGNYEQRAIAGFGYDFGNKNILMIDYDIKMFDDKTIEEEKLFKITMQVNF